MSKLSKLIGRLRKPKGKIARSAQGMNFWDADWDLQDCCPCDLHFNDWVADQGLTGRLIYHFGSGTHHVVGLEQATNGSGNAVVCITASFGEYEAYIKLAAEKPAVSRDYLCYFGDIYLTNPRLLPTFDVVTLFHLCEFFAPSTVSPAYGGVDDRRLLDIFAGMTRPGGHILFYTGSNAFDKAAPVIADWEQAGGVERIGEFKTLLVFRKTV